MLTCGPRAGRAAPTGGAGGSGGSRARSGRDGCGAGVLGRCEAGAGEGRAEEGVKRAGRK